MNPAPGPPFEVVETAAGRLYRLPARRLGAIRCLAVFPLVLAIGTAAFIVQFYLTRAARGPLDEWAWATFVVLGLGWTRASYSLASYAAAIWCGRTEIEIADTGAVWGTDRVGWFRVRWGKLKPGTARKLVLAEFARFPDKDGKPIARPYLLWNLTVETARGRKVSLAPAHPRELLTELANELATRLALTAPAPPNDPNTGESPAVGPAAPVPVVIEEPLIPTRDVTEQPRDSRVGVERHPDGVTVTVPPIGIWNVPGGLFFAGVLLTLIGAGVTIAVLNALIRQNAKFNPGMFVGVAFFCVGAGLVLAAINSGRKRAVLAVVGDRLLTLETGPFGSRRREFARTELLDIACGPSNVKVNNKPVPQLQIVAPDKKTVGMLTGRDETELKWLATVLRQALGIPGEAPGYRKPMSGTPQSP